MTRVVQIQQPKQVIGRTREGSRQLAEWQEPKTACAPIWAVDVEMATWFSIGANYGLAARPWNDIAVST